MKRWNLLPFHFLKILGQQGQSVVEFVLLLVVMTTITYGFVYFMNRSLARYWEHSVNLIVNDRPGVKTLILPK